MFSLLRLIMKNAKPRYKLFDEDARRLTNRVGGFMIGSTFVLAIVVNQTGFDMREYPSMNWLTEFRAIRLQAAASVSQIDRRTVTNIWALPSGCCDSTSGVLPSNPTKSTAPRVNKLLPR